MEGSLRTNMRVKAIPESRPQLPPLTLHPPSVKSGASRIYDCTTTFRRMVKKVIQRGRSERKDEAYSTGYVEPLSDVKTKPGKGRVSARLGCGGCSKPFFTILP